MRTPKVGILISRDGVTSVALLGDDPEARQEAQSICAAIRREIMEFDEQVRQRLMNDKGPQTRNLRG